MKRQLIFLSLLILNTIMVSAADAVRFSAQGPSTVVMDRPFNIEFTINTGSGRDFRAPEIAAFDVLAGPYTSTSSSIQIINGRQTSSEEVSYTYTLQAKKTGTFTIPSASITVDGKKVTSNGLSIKVLPADANARQQQGGGNAQPQQAQPSSSASVSNDNIFIRANVSKTNVYEQEAILVTYKLYALVDVIQCGAKKLPDFNGFMKQDLDQKKPAQLQLERYNGKNYQTAVLYQVVLYPQHSGVIEIGKATFESVIRVQSRAQVRSIFDDFFDTYSNVNKLLTAPAVKVNVAALPTPKPASFSGIVGHFDVNANLSSNHVKTNDAITLKMTIAGAGNLKMIKNPEFKIPNGIDSYDPKVTNNFKTTASGVSGNKVIEYTLIPRHSGSYDIAPVQFAYFDTQSKTYRVLSTPVYKIQVDKGAGGEGPAVVSNYVDKEDVKQLGHDIRYIFTNNVEVALEKQPLFGSVISWLMYILPLILAIVLFVLFRNQAKENANISLVKNKKANKVAQKRLKLAQKLLTEGKKDQFYEEVLKAVWTYLSDKLSIPVAVLTKDKVESELAAHQVNETLVNEFLQILNTCEFARYAPASGQQEMGNLFDETVKAISQLEDVYKKN